MKLTIDIHNTTLMETHYIVYGVDDITMEEAAALLPIGELEMLAEGAKRKIVVRGGKRKIIFKCPKGSKHPKPRSRNCVKMSSKEKARRSKGARKGARKSRRKRAMSNRKRARSMSKRKGLVKR